MGRVNIIFHTKLGAKSSRFLGLILLFLISLSAYAQDDAFYIGGKFKVDGGSNRDARIVIEKDGKKVRTIAGDARFEIPLDFQAIYVLSFEKDGYVTKRLRFDTHVPETRIEGGFQFFDFTVEIFEQYDDVNVVVFNQPVGQISYDDLLGDFDYDTDYTKSIQTQIDQAMKEVEEKKIEKEKERAEEAKKEAETSKKVDQLVSSANKNLSGGNYEEAIEELKSASELKPDDEGLKTKLKEAEAKFEEEKRLNEKQAAFDDLFEKAEAAYKSGDLNEAQKLFNEANGVMGGDPRVKKALEQISEEQEKRKQNEAQFNQLLSEAQNALDSDQPELAQDKLKEALKLAESSEANELLAKAEEAIKLKQEENAAFEAKKSQLDDLLNNAAKQLEKDDLEQALDNLNQAKELGLEDQRIDQIEKDIEARKSELAAAQLEEEQKQKQYNELINQAKAALVDGKLAEAKSLRDQAKELAQDEQFTQLNNLIEEKESALEAAEKEAAEKAKELDKLFDELDKSLANNDITSSESTLEKIKGISPNDNRLAPAEQLLAEKKLAVQEAEKNKAKIQELILEGVTAVKSGDFAQAESNASQVQSLGGNASEIQAAIDAKKAEEEEAKKAQQEALNELISAIEKAIKDEDSKLARSLWSEASEQYEDERLAELDAQVKTLEQAAEKAKQNEQKIAQLNKDFQDALNSKDVSLAQSKLDEIALLGGPTKSLSADLSALKSSLMSAEEAEKERSRQIENAIQKGLSSISSSDIDELSSAIEELKSIDAENEKLIEFEEALSNLKRELAQKQLEEEERKKIQERQKQFDDLMTKGQKSLDKSNLLEAKTAFESALALMPESQEAKAKISEINEKLSAQSEEEQAAAEAAELARKTEEFKTLMDAGKQALASGNLDDASEKFNLALGLNIDNDEVNSELAKVSRAREEALANNQKQELENELKRILKEADNAFSQKNLESAQNLYSKAQALKPGDDYIYGQLEKIKALKATAASNAEKEKAKKSRFDGLVSEADANVNQGKLEQAQQLYKDALAVMDSDEVSKKLAKVSGEIETARAEKAKAAADALALDREREREQLAKIIEEESKKTTETKLAQATIEVEERPSTVIISPVKIGDDAIKSSPAARLTEEQKYDQQQAVLERQQEELRITELQKELLAKYPKRKTIETDSVGNSVITYVYINRGTFVTIYKKVEHNWGGVFYFVDDRATNRRFWEHETQ